MGEPFAHEYAEFNEDGLVSLLRCQSCATPIGGLGEVPSRKFPGRTLTRLRRYANFRSREVVLSDRSKCLVFLCADCEEVDMDPHVERVGLQIRTAWRRELEANRRPANQIDDLMERTRDLKALTRDEAFALQPAPVAPPPPRPIEAAVEEEAGNGR